MNKRLLLLTLASLFALAPGLQAQGDKKGGGEKKAPAPKSAADIARDAFNKARNDPPGKLDAARMQQVISAGVTFVATHPTNNNINNVIRELVTWPDMVMKDRKTQGAQRSSYYANLKLELVNARYKPEVNEDGKAALAALDVAVADMELRDTPSTKAMLELREKIDALAGVPKTGRFMADRELSYGQIVAGLQGAEKAKAHYTKMTEHPEKGVQDMAKRELNLIGLKQTPLELKFTSLDGKEVDVAAFRGKAVAVYFWSATNGRSTGGFEALRMAYSDHKKKGLEIVTISLDKPEDKEKLDKYVKENKLPFAVLFDGKQGKNDLATKLNVSSGPNLAVFNQKGELFANNLQPNQLDSAVKQLYAPPAKK